MDLVGESEASVSQTIQKLVSLLDEESRFSRGIEISKIESFKKELEIIWVLIRDVSAISVEEELSHEVKIWLKQAKEVAEMVKDFVDKYVLKASQAGSQLSFVSFLGRAGSSNNRHKLSSDIESIGALLAEIQERGQRHGISNHVSRGGVATVSDRYRFHVGLTDPRLMESTVGIDSVAYELMDLLLDGESGCSVLSLVGVGGVGKTTLAKRVYNVLLNKSMVYDYIGASKRFVGHAWITVSASYDLEAILIDLVRQFGAAGNRHVRKEELIDTLNQYLQSKRYLIVFDDVWHEEFWQEMRRVLPDNGKGSRIIITTRRDTVAAFCKENSFDHAHLVEPLTETMSWDLFCQRAFHYEHEAHCPPGLDNIISKVGMVPYGATAR